MRDILNARQAAQVIGCSRQELAEKGKRGLWPFIKVITPKESGKKVNRYEINKRDLANYLKVPYEEVDRRLSLEEK